VCELCGVVFISRGCENKRQHPELISLYLSDWQLQYHNLTDSLTFLQLEKRLESANKQRELNNMVKAERQKLREERQKRARDKKQRMLKEDLDFDVEQDETFNNDDGQSSTLNFPP